MPLAPPLYPWSFCSWRGQRRLADCQSLSEAIKQVDENTNGYPSYFMINCAHPDQFTCVLRDAPWARRIRGVRANASRRSHAELDSAPELDPGNPTELAGQYRELTSLMP